MIPITFNKDDANNPKKGTVRGQDLASFLSVSTIKKAGILDIWENPVSATASYIPGDAYATLTFNKGYIMIYGRCIYVEQGETLRVPLPTGSGTEAGVVGIKIDLSQISENEVSWFKKVTTLRQDNLLNTEINGIYEFGLYNYTATASSFTLGTKIAPVIQNIGDYLQGEVFVTQPDGDVSTKLATTQFVAKAIENNNTNYISKNFDLLQYGAATGQDINIRDIAQYKQITLEAKANNRWAIVTIPIDLMLDEIGLYGYFETFVTIKPPTSTYAGASDGALYRFTRTTVKISNITSAVYSRIKGIK